MTCSFIFNSLVESCLANNSFHKLFTSFSFLVTATRSYSVLLGHLTVSGGGLDHHCWGWRVLLTLRTSKGSRPLLYILHLTAQQQHRNYYRHPTRCHKNVIRPPMSRLTLQEMLLKQHKDAINDMLPKLIPSRLSSACFNPTRE